MLRSYTPADALTIGNATCGTIAIFLCLDYLATGERRFLWTAFILLPAALVFDVLDGYVARLNRKRQSLLGADLDSLSDVISFGGPRQPSSASRSDSRWLGHALSSATSSCAG
jgi:CDP-diacylglycerol--serine O-phosphatidyltransferase